MGTMSNANDDISQSHLMRALELMYRQAFQGHQAATLQVVYQCHVEDFDLDYHLIIASNALQFVVGIHPEPTLTLTFDHYETPAILLAGEMDPMEAFLHGKVRSDGHLLLAMHYFILFANISPDADLR